MTSVQELTPCGTTTAAQRHRKRGEHVCEACQAAEAEYQADYKRRMKAEQEARRQAVEARSRDPWWWELSACRGVASGLFGPPEGHDVRAEIEARRHLAGTFCARCPVMRDCAGYGDDTKSEGVFGGELRRYILDSKGKRAYRRTNLLPVTVWTREEGAA